MSLQPTGSAGACWHGLPTRIADLGPELHAAVPADERVVADRVSVATRYRLPAGPWSPGPTLPDLKSSDTAMVIDGLIVRDIVLGSRASSQLLGPGDLFRPADGDDSSLPSRSRWTSGPHGAVVAVLDERFTRASQRWPGLATVLRRRLADQLEASTLRTAIVSLPRAEQRIVALLWHFADRWGVVTPQGVVVRLPLTHELLGRLIGARRPTVSLALQSLTEDGAVTRKPDCWVLANGSKQLVEREPGPAKVVRISG